jgi:hypothetical protein
MARKACWTRIRRFIAGFAMQLHGFSVRYFRLDDLLHFNYSHPLAVLRSE